jgi:hypothetical protein
VALGEVFPECTIFGTRGRALPREPLPRKLFPECCTRGRLPRVFLALPLVLQALGEAGGSCSEHVLNYTLSSLSRISSCRLFLPQQLMRHGRRSTTTSPPNPGCVSSPRAWRCPRCRRATPLLLSTL